MLQCPEGPSLGRCQGQAQTHTFWLLLCFLQPKVLLLGEEVRTHLLKLLLFWICLKNLMCSFRAQCDHSQKFLAKIFIITICSGRLIGWSGWWSMTSIHICMKDGSGGARGGVSKAPLESGTLWTNGSYIKQRGGMSKFWDWEKSNTGASRQSNLEVQSKENRKWHLIQENVSDLDNKIN